MLETNYNYLQLSNSVTPPYTSFTNPSINSQSVSGIDAQAVEATDFV